MYCGILQTKYLVKLFCCSYMLNISLDVDMVRYIFVLSVNAKYPKSRESSVIDVERSA